MTNDPTINKRNNHWTKDCRLKHNNNSTASNKPEINKSNLKKIDPICTYCHKNNHSLEQCFLKKKHENKTEAKSDDNSHPKAQKPKHGHTVEITNPDFISTNSVATNQQ